MNQFRKFRRCVTAVIAVTALISIAFPEVAEARRGGRGGGHGGDLLWIPVVLIGGLIYLISAHIPELWDWLLGLVIIGLLSLIVTLGLEWIGLINRDDFLYAGPCVFFAIICGPKLWSKVSR